MKGERSKSVAKHADSKLGVTRSGKADKDPEKPKRPSSAFFVFMEDFRKEFKEANPTNKSVATVGKAGGAKWKSMTEAEKAPYAEEADKRKTQYEKNIKEYEKNIQAKSKKQAVEANDAEEESDKSESEANGEDDESSAEEEVDD